MILLIDNYDSFTYNLVQYLAEVSGTETNILVKRNDAITLSEIEQRQPSHIVISPGPCTPNESGVSLEIFQSQLIQCPILGVCLGHQALAQAYGGKVVRAQLPMHGKTSLIKHNGQGIFSGIEQDFIATRYHSLVVEKTSLPTCLKETAWSEDGTIMGLQHIKYPHIMGLQFHPESILTRVGKSLLDNFLKM